MSKRSGSIPQPPRKRRKGGVSYASVDVDALAERRLREDIRVWNVTKSKTNGRVSATRKTLQYFHVDRSESCPEHQPHAVNTEDVDSPVDLELDEGPSAKLVSKRKKAKVAKENDSVSPLLNPLCKPDTYAPSDKNGRLAWVPFNYVG